MEKNYKIVLSQLLGKRDIMKNYYKHMLVMGIISLCCSITHLSADLLNGPYSSESQELVKLTQNSTMPIPDKFNSQEKAIIEKYRKINNKGECYKSAIYFNDDLLQILKNKPIFLEALCQILVSKNDTYCLKNLADIAIQITNEELFIYFIKNMSDPVVKEYLSHQLVELRWNIDCFKGIEIGNTTEAECKKKREELKRIINLLFTHHKNLISALNEFAEWEIMETSSFFRSPFSENYLEFLIGLGVNLNLPKIDDSNKPTTILDLLNTKLKSYADVAVDARKSKQETIKFLKSKGAKTYAELTAAEKGQKL